MIATVIGPGAEGTVELQYWQSGQTVALPPKMLRPYVDPED